MTNIECDFIDLGNKKKEDMQISRAIKNTVIMYPSCGRRKSNTKRGPIWGPKQIQFEFGNYFKCFIVGLIVYVLPLMI